ncbi:hypothetical protein AgCh_014248 [Apium graveolens]
MLEPSKFDEFARILSEFSSSTNVKDGDMLISKLKNLFVDDHRDLLLALNNFLPRNIMVVEKKDDTKFSDNNKCSWLLSDSGNEFFNKICDCCIEKNDKSFSVLIKFCELIVSCHEKRITVREVDLELRDLFDGDPDLYIECTHLLADLWEMDDEEPGLDYSGFGFLNKRREKCIVELYKGSYSDYTYKGEDLVEILRNDPVRRIIARDVLVERMRQKRMQLEERKLCLDHVWRKIFEDIREKGAVCRHCGFLDQLTEVSKNNYSDSD